MTNQNINKSSPWQAVVLTSFPEMFPGPLGFSLAGQGLRDKLWAIESINIRDFTVGKYNSIDDATFGGGPGMVMRPDVVDGAIKYSEKYFSSLPLLYLTPRGKRINQKKITELSNGPGVRIICGRYEGLDQRIIDVHNVEEINIADLILSGGEPAAIILLDACIRLLRGIIGNIESLDNESFKNDLLEYPHYTRPQGWKGHKVPEILLSGNHEKINQWRLKQSRLVTKERRPDLWAQYVKKNPH